MPNKKLRNFMFASLYFAQGTILSYFTALNAIYFLSRGLTMTDVGVFASIALIPFVVKIFFGMLSDRVNLFGLGHRKPYILLGLLIQALCLVIVSFIDPAEMYWGFVTLAFITQMGMALYDTCTDGFALDTTPVEEQGTIQGIMVGGRALGVVLTSAVFGLLAEFVGWHAVFWLLAAFALIPIPMVLQIRETKREAGTNFQWRAFAAFKQSQVVWLAVLGFVFFFVMAGTNQLVNPYLQTEFGISLSMAGYFTSVWGAGVVLGGALGGRVYTRIGMKNAAWVSIFTVVFGVGLLAVIGSPGAAWGLVALFGLAYGVQNTVYFALAMQYTDPRIAASMFSILMAVTNIGQGVGMGVSGALSDGVGFQLTFVIIAGLNLLAVPLLPGIFRPKSTSP